MYKIFQIIARASNKNCHNIHNVTTEIHQFGKRYLSATIHTSPFDLHLLETGPPTSAEVTKEEILALYKTMDLVRKLEKEMANLYLKKLSRGFCHLYSGEEAVGTGIRSVMTPEDTVTTSYRCHGWHLLMGGTPYDVAAELMGFETGNARGKGGSMHMYGPKFYGGNAIVGSQVPLGTGIALAHKYKGDGGVCITVFGDGASNQGQTHEAMNIAKLLTLPVLYVLENNIYAMGTSVVRHSSNSKLYEKFDNVPGIRLDGMDVLCVKECAKFGLDYVRSGEGPLILEMMTYRYFGHSMSDPGISYRSREEVNEIRQNRDPIDMLKKKILASGLGTEEDLKKISEETKAKVQEGVKAAMKDKPLDVKEVAFDIYCNYPEKIRMPGFQKNIQHKNTGSFNPACK